MTESVRIFCKNTSSYTEVPVGISLEEIYQRLNIHLPYLCVGAQVNNRAEGLKYRIYKPKDIEFLDISSSSGMRIYVRSLCFVLYMATDEVMPNCRLRIEHPISHGYYCEINHHQRISDEQLEQIKMRMQAIINADLPFIREETHTREAVKLFREKNLNDKADLLESSGQLYTDYYRLDHHYDYYYGSLLPSTGMLYLFDLQRYDDGLLLIVPKRTNPKELEPVVPQPKLMQVLEEFAHYNFIAGLSNVGKMNKLIMKGQASMLLQVSEALQEKKIAAIADEIAARKNIRIIL
ncbi:MAG: nucleoside kinase, partial [Bacteroidales bacterium]